MYACSVMEIKTFLTGGPASRRCSALQHTARMTSPDITSFSGLAALSTLIIGRSAPTSSTRIPNWIWPPADRRAEDTSSQAGLRRRHRQRIVLFGLFPVFRVGGLDLVASLKEGGRGGSAGKERHRARHTLVVAQVALALDLVPPRRRVVVWRSFYFFDPE